MCYLQQLKRPYIEVRFNCKLLLYFAMLCPGITVVPGTPGPVANVEDAVQFAEEHGLPVIFKAAYGGGGRGMRRVDKMEVCYIDLFQS